MFLDDKPQGEVKELDETRQLLLRAAALIEQHGWCQNAYARGSAFCAMGALQMADTGSVGACTPVISKAAFSVNQALRQSIISWNDKPERTKEEVIAKLREVAFSH